MRENQIRIKNFTFIESKDTFIYIGIYYICIFITRNCAKLKDLFIENVEK